MGQMGVEEIQQLLGNNSSSSSSSVVCDAGTLDTAAVLALRPFPPEPLLHCKNRSPRNNTGGASLPFSFLPAMPWLSPQVISTMYKIHTDHTRGLLAEPLYIHSCKN